MSLKIEPIVHLLSEHLMPRIEFEEIRNLLLREFRDFSIRQGVPFMRMFFVLDVSG